MRIATYAQLVERLTPDGDCLLWTGATHDRGYGRMRHEGATRPVHHVAWELFTGKRVPRNLFVLHRCHRPACARGEHLYAGTQKQNMRDRRLAGNVPQRYPRTLEKCEIELTRLQREIARLQRRHGEVGQLYYRLREAAG